MWITLRMSARLPRYEAATVADPWLEGLQLDQLKIYEAVLARMAERAENRARAQAKVPQVRV